MEQETENKTLKFAVSHSHVQPRFADRAWSELFGCQWNSFFTTGPKNSRS